MVTFLLNFYLADNIIEPFSIAIINESGAVVKRQQFQAVNGITKFLLNTGNLASGFYWLQLVNSKGNLKTAKFFKQ